MKIEPALVDDIRVHLWKLRERLPMFVITDHPTDWPDFYVARLHLSLPEPLVTDFAVLNESLERLRDIMEALGLAKLMRADDDDPVILETWL